MVKNVNSVKFLYYNHNCKMFFYNYEIGRDLCEKIKQIILASLSFLCVLRAPAILAEASDGNVSELAIASEDLGVSVGELENLDELILEAIEQLPQVEVQNPFFIASNFGEIPFSIVS